MNNELNFPANFERLVLGCIDADFCKYILSLFSFFQRVFITYLLAKIGVDTAENEPLEVWGKIQFIIHSPPYSRTSATM